MGRTIQEGRKLAAPANRLCRDLTGHTMPLDHALVCPSPLRPSLVRRSEEVTLAPFEYDHLFYEARGSCGERLTVSRYLIGDQGDVLVPFLRDEYKNV